jgi:hypothetical protein
MSRPPLEVADLIRTAGAAFIERNRAGSVGSMSKCCGLLCTVVPPRWAVISTSAPAAGIAPSLTTPVATGLPEVSDLGAGTVDRPRRRELLPTRYVHVVFTLPRELAPLALQNKKIVYDSLFRASAETILQVARDPRHLGAEIGFSSVLHTWNQKLELNPHVHCVIPAGGLSLDHTRWIKSHNAFFLPVKVLGRVFRGKFVAALKRAFREDRLRFQGSLTPLAQPKTFAAWLRPLFRKDWVVYSKRPFGGPEYVLQYLGRYTHRVAMSNHRLLFFSGWQSHFSLARLRSPQRTEVADSIAR